MTPKVWRLESFSLKIISEIKKLMTIFIPERVGAAMEIGIIALTTRFKRLVAPFDIPATLA